MFDKAPAAPTARPHLRAAFQCFWLSLFGLVLLRTAWVGDDAYFTFRTIDNFVHGYGLRWNVAERVQTYTHPLWMAVVTVFYAVTGEPYFTSIAISIALTLLTVWHLMRLAPSLWSAALGLTVLVCSRAFVDYSTAGLENALTNFLLVLFLRSYLSAQRAPSTPSFLASLLVLNRLDLTILVLPPLVVMLPRGRRRGDYVRFAAGFLPVVLWELFSLWYYGFLFPNTVYAKLKTGLPESELLVQGLLYLFDSLTRDPLTLVALTFTTLWSLVANPRRTRPVAIGILLYVAAVVYAGGDFMSGRMLEVPLFASAVILVATDVMDAFKYQWMPIAVAVVLGVSGLRAIVQNGNSTDPSKMTSGGGVSDERLFYFDSNALVNYSREAPFWPNSKWMENGLQARRERQHFIMYCCNGMLGYSAGPDIHILDTLGLGDPLLARLRASKGWRVGHYPREVPRGYDETLESGENQLRTLTLRMYYDRLSLVTRGRLWDRRRLRTILRMSLLGQYESLLEGSAGAGTCEYELLMATLHAPLEGGRFSLTTESTTPAGCSWTAQASDSWIKLLDAAGGRTAGTINFNLSAHRGVDARTGSITVSWPDGATTFTIRQDGLPNCAYTTRPPAQSALSDNREYSVVVVPSDPSCGWKAEPGAPWVAVTHGSTNTGVGIVVYRVLANGTQSPRVGTIDVTGLVVGGTKVVVTQAP